MNALLLIDTYSYDIGDHRSEEHIVELYVFVLEDIFEAAAWTVVGDDADVGRLRACSNECTDVVVAQVF